MAILIKTGGEWQTVQRPYMKINGTWIPMNEVERKVSGAWISNYHYDVTPPPSPIVTVTVLANDGTPITNA